MMSEAFSKGRNNAPRSPLPVKRLPVIPPLPPEDPGLDPNPTVAICGECRLEIKKGMHYVCPNSRCPLRTQVLR